MRLINLTRNRKQRLLTMLIALVPEYKSINITKTKGLPIVIFKEQWWKFWTRYTVNITDICISEIPKRLDQMAQDKGLGRYREFFNNIIFDIVAYKENPHTQYTDIVDYLWDNFTKINYKENITILPLSTERTLVAPNYLPLPFSQTMRSFAVNSIIKDSNSYFSFLNDTVKRVAFPKSRLTSTVQHIYTTIADKMKEINVSFRLRTAYN